MFRARERRVESVDETDRADHVDHVDHEGATIWSPRQLVAFVIAGAVGLAGALFLPTIGRSRRMVTRDTGVREEAGTTAGAHA